MIAEIMYGKVTSGSGTPLTINAMIFFSRLMKYQEGI